MFGDIGLGQENTISGMIDNVRSYFGLLPEQKQNIKIDAQEVAYSTDMVIYNSSFVELFRIRGNYDFSLSCNKEDSATPDGNRITKGITINNHTISIKDGIFALKEIELNNVPNKIEKVVSKANNLVGVLANQVVPIKSKAVKQLMSIYSIGQGIVDSANQLKELLLNKDTSPQQIQTLLENILLDNNNGNYIITYAGKSYNKMACIELSTSESLQSLVNISMTFEYAPINKNIFNYRLVKGWNTIKSNSEQIASTRDAKTFLAEGVDTITKLIKEGLF